MGIGQEPNVNLVLVRWRTKRMNALPVFPTEQWTLAAMPCHTDYPPPPPSEQPLNMLLKQRRCTLGRVCLTHSRDSSGRASRRSAEELLVYLLHLCWQSWTIHWQSWITIWLLASYLLTLVHLVLWLAIQLISEFVCVVGNSGMLRANDDTLIYILCYFTQGISLN